MNWRYVNNEMIKFYLGKSKFTVRIVHHELFLILNDGACTSNGKCCNIILPDQSANVQGYCWFIDFILDHLCQLMGMTAETDIQSIEILLSGLWSQTWRTWEWSITRCRITAFGGVSKYVDTLGIVIVL